MTEHTQAHTTRPELSPLPCHSLLDGGITQSAGALWCTSAKESLSALFESLNRFLLTPWKYLFHHTTENICISRGKKMIMLIAGIYDLATLQLWVPESTGKITPPKPDQQSQTLHINTHLLLSQSFLVCSSLPTIVDANDVRTIQERTWFFSIIWKVYLCTKYLCTSGCLLLEYH